MRLTMRLLVGLCLVGLALPARAETITEGYRSSFGEFRDISVNPVDGTAWVASGTAVLHLAQDGQIITRIDGLPYPHLVSVDQANGSVWVATEQRTGTVVHYTEDGIELGRGNVDYEHINIPVEDIVANPVDGTCFAIWDGPLTRLQADGSMSFVDIDFIPNLLAVDARDGSWWVMNEYGIRYLVHYSVDDVELWQSNPNEYLATRVMQVDPANGSLLIGDGGAGYGTLRRLLPNGEVQNLGTFGAIDSIAPLAGGTCWFTLYDTGEAIHIADDGHVITRMSLGPANTINNVYGTGPDGSWWARWGLPSSSSGSSESVGRVSRFMSEGTETFRAEWEDVDVLDAATPDSSCWALSSLRATALHIGRYGGLLQQLVFSWATWPAAIATNPTDGSWWASNASKVAYYAAGSMEPVHLYTPDVVPTSPRLAVDTHDGSCWLACVGYHDAESREDYNAELVHLAVDGTELAHRTVIWTIHGLAVNPIDHSAWVSVRIREAAGLVYYVWHLSADGAELWRGNYFANSLAVNPIDGSCWLNLPSENTVLHLDADAQELSRTPLSAYEIAVSPVDGSCWAAVTNDILHQTAVVHLAADGLETGHLDGYLYGGRARSLSIDPHSGDCWFADKYTRQVVRLTSDLYAGPFSDIPNFFWAAEAITAVKDAGVFPGYKDGTFRPKEEVHRDQMATFIARALCGGDESVPTGPATASFLDVPVGTWGYDHIEYCKAQQIVQGYWDGYHPERTVKRDQLAVYIARTQAPESERPDLPGYTPPAIPNFNDVPTNFWAYKFIEYCYENGVVEGYWDGYHPERTVLRDQMAVYIARAFSLLP